MHGEQPAVCVCVCVCVCGLLRHIWLVCVCVCVDCSGVSDSESQAPLSMGFPRQEYWESQFLGRLIRSSGSPRRRKGVWGSGSGDWGSEILKKEKRTNVFFPLHSLVLVNYTTQFKLCARNYSTTVYLAGRQFHLHGNLLGVMLIF